MTDFTIVWIEQKEYEGRKYAKASIKGIGGDESYPDISLSHDKWGEKLFQLSNGGQIKGNPWKNPKSGKWVLYPIDDSKPARRAPASSQGAIKQAMERKEESISKFQGNKEESIKLAGSSRDATMIITTFYPEFADMMSPEKEEFIKRKWVEWKDYFLLGF